MRYSNRAPFQQQASFLRRQFLQDGELPFSDVLSEGVVSQALTALNVCWVDRMCLGCQVRPALALEGASSLHV
jgi:hypothetical protein